MIVQNGAIVTYQGQWQTTIANATSGQQQIVNDILSALTARGLLVRNSSIGDPGFFGLPGTAYRVTLTLQVQNGMGYGDENDIILIVRGEVYQRTGKFPLSDTIPTVQQPAQAAQPTGQPDAGSGYGAGEFGVEATGFWQKLKDGFSTLTSSTEFVVVGAGIGLIIAVLLIASAQRRVVTA